MSKHLRNVRRYKQIQVKIQVKTDGREMSHSTDRYRYKYRYRFKQAAKKIKLAAANRSNVKTSGKCYTVKDEAKADGRKNRTGVKNYKKNHYTRASFFLPFHHLRELLQGSESSGASFEFLFFKRKETLKQTQLIALWDWDGRRWSLLRPGVTGRFTCAFWDWDGGGAVARRRRRMLRLGVPCDQRFRVG
jgi:hypothetical protein